MFNFFNKQLRSVIEWQNPSPEVLIWRWDGGTDEIKNASKLIINPGQAVIFVYEGQIRAIHDYPGLFELKTANIPFWTTISNIMQGFVSHHKANIYFVRITEFINQKWGTKSPVKYEDPKYKFPVGLRAFGNFSFKISDIRKFFTEFVSNRDIVTISEVRNIIVDRIIGILSNILASASFSYTEIDKRRIELSKITLESVKNEFAPLGFELTDFRIENTDFDDDTKARISKIADQITDLHIINSMAGISSSASNNFAKIEQIRALKQIAERGGSLAGIGPELVAAITLGQAMSQVLRPLPEQDQKTQNITASYQENYNNFGSLNTNSIEFSQKSQLPPPESEVNCQNCQALIKTSVKFCPECGTPNKHLQIKCSKCQSSISATSKFCPECGNKISK